MIKSELEGLCECRIKAEIKSRVRTPYIPKPILTIVEGKCLYECNGYDVDCEDYKPTRSTDEY